MIYNKYKYNQYLYLMNLQENILRIKEVMGLINENDINRLKRRFNTIDELIKLALKSTLKRRFIENENEFIEIIKNDVVETMYYDHFADLDDGGKEWGEVYHLICDYIDKVHKDRLIDIYKSNYLKT